MKRKKEKQEGLKHTEKGKRKVQGVPQLQTAALPRPQEEEETGLTSLRSKPQSCVKEEDPTQTKMSATDSVMEIFEPFLSDVLCH